MANNFEGFPREFTDFLYGLRYANTQNLLAENKVVYKQLISEPLLLLFFDLTEAALDVSETLITKPSRCVSSMYNDMRFSKATPLKEYMYIRFREPFRSDNILGLYFDMGCTHYSYGIRIYKQTSAGMDLIRKSVLANREAFTRELSVLEDSGMEIIGHNYAKDRYLGETEVLKELLNKRNFCIPRELPIGESVFNGKLQDEIAHEFKKLKGIYALLKKSLYGDGA